MDEEGDNAVFSDEQTGMRIYIGENDDRAFSDTSLVYCTFPVGKTNATIGILGPRRMDYKRVVASRKYLAIAMADGDSLAYPPMLYDKEKE